MTVLSFIHALICLAIALRLMVYRKRGATHRPLASLLAYVLIVASGSVCVAVLFNRPDLQLLPAIMLDAVLLLAICAAQGNVLGLLTTREQPHNRLTEILRGAPWH